MKITDIEKSVILEKYYKSTSPNLIVEQVYMSDATADGKVSTLQKLLNDKKSANITVDGKLGPKTLQAIANAFNIDVNAIPLPTPMKTKKPANQPAVIDKTTPEPSQPAPAPGQPQTAPAQAPAQQQGTPAPAQEPPGVPPAQPSIFRDGEYKDNLE